MPVDVRVIIVCWLCPPSCVCCLFSKGIGAQDFSALDADPASFGAKQNTSAGCRVLRQDDHDDHNVRCMKQQPATISPQLDRRSFRCWAADDVRLLVSIISVSINRLPRLIFSTTNAHPMPHHCPDTDPTSTRGWTRMCLP